MGLQDIHSVMETEISGENLYWSPEIGRKIGYGRTPASPLCPPKRIINLIASKGKAVRLQAWSGPESSRKLKFPDYMTTAQDGGKVVSLTRRPPLPQEMLLVLISVRG
jgi:hypothetical protein